MGAREDLLVEGRIHALLVEGTYSSKGEGRNGWEKWRDLLVEGLVHAQHLPVPLLLLPSEAGISSAADICLLSCMFIKSSVYIIIVLLFLCVFLCMYNSFVGAAEISDVPCTLFARRSGALSLRRVGCRRLGHS